MSTILPRNLYKLAEDPKAIVIGSPYERDYLGGTMIKSQTQRAPNQHLTPSNIEWDLTSGPLSELLELLDTQV